MHAVCLYPLFLFSLTSSDALVHGGYDGGGSQHHVTSYPVDHVAASTAYQSDIYFLDKPHATQQYPSEAVLATEV